MSEVETLPPDQRAVVQMVLRQGRRYDEIAELLGIDAEAVRTRAHDALDALGPESGRRLPASRRGEVADYLLGQQSEAERAATRDHLAGSAGARAWARAVAGELRPLAGERGLPEIPGDGGRPDGEPVATGDAVSASRERGREGRAPAGTAPPLDEERPAGGIAPPPGRPSSKLGGAILLLGIAVIAAVVIVLALNDGDDDGSDRASRTAPTNTQTAPAQATPVAQINLNPPRGAADRDAAGLAQVVRSGRRLALIVAGQGVAPGAYALWLYTSPQRAKLLGFVPNRVGRDGRFATQGDLPADAESYRQLIVTRENVASGSRDLPDRPGRIVLAGRLTTGQRGR